VLPQAFIEVSLCSWGARLPGIRRNHICSSFGKDLSAKVDGDRPSEAWPANRP